MGHLNSMLGTTTLTELSRYNTPMGVEVKYHCSACGHHLTFSDQQRFYFCYLCGARVSKIRRNRKGG